MVAWGRVGGWAWGGDRSKGRRWKIGLGARKNNTGGSRNSTA